MTSVHKKLVVVSSELRGLVTQLEADQIDLDESVDKLENHLQQIVICKR
jgi:exonuclease VII small subunit